MQFLFFLIVYPILWLVSILPFRLLYILSDFVYFIVYHLIQYRKKIVRGNIARAFPELPVEKRREIERKSYRHLCDMFLEMIKTLTISAKEMEKRFATPNLQVYLDLENEGKSIAMMCAHYATYEWAISMNAHTKFRAYAIYKKIANRHFDKLVRNIRSKFGATLITTKETIPTIEANQAAGLLGVYGFASDQSPKASRIYHWTTFMGIESPVITGAEMLAKKYDLNVIFMQVRKIKRGYYEATFEKPFADPTSVPDYEISDRFMQMVEMQIREAPEYYLWTHKRWKSTRKNSITKMM